MADYYPLIARAVAGLEKNNGENRRALYERARGALLAQLRSVTPALNESDITRERLALEESIRKVEAESARKFTGSARQPPPPRIRPIEPHRPEEVRENSAPPRRPVAPPAEPSQEARLDGARRPWGPLPSLKPVVSSPVLPRAATAEQRQPDLDLPEHPLPPEQRAPTAPLALRRPAGERPPIARTGKELGNVLPRINDLPEAFPPAENRPREPYPPPPIVDLDRAQRFRGRHEERFQERGEERVQERTFDRAQDRAPAPDRPPVLRSELGMSEPEAPAKDAFEPVQESYSLDDFSEPMLESSFVLDDAHPVSGMPRHIPPPPEEESRLRANGGERPGMAGMASQS